MKAGPQTAGEYTAGFPGGVQEIRQKIRATVREAAPEAREAIKYAMPTFVTPEITSPRSKTTSGCTLPPTAPRYSKPSYQDTKAGKARCDSRSTGRSPST